MLSQLKTDESARKGHERRNQPRVGMRANIDIIRLDVQRMVQRVTLRDISVGGISFINNLKLERKERLLLCLPTGEGKRLTIVYEVRRVIPVTSHAWLIGASIQATATQSVSTPQPDPQPKAA